MNPDKIINASLLDILFEGKNKEYGAYELRKTYNSRMNWAMLGMASICVLFFLTRIFANDHDKIKHTIPIIDTKLVDLPKEKTPEPIPVKPPKVEQQRVQSIKITPPRILPDEQVEDPLPPVEAAENAKIGLITQDGIKEADFVAPPVEHTTGAVEAPKTKTEAFEKEFIRIEKEAMFPGGLPAWKKYLERTLNANAAVEDGAAMGDYLVKVQFVVDKEGNISNVKAIEVPKACPACGPEAVKVIKNGPKWEPAIQNSQKITYQAMQYITFKVTEE